MRAPSISCGRSCPQLRETDLLTLAVGASGIVAMLLLERRLPRVPAALVVLLGSIAVSVAFALESHGVHVVGDLPAGLGRPQLPGVGVEALPLLLAGAVGIALVAFAEAVGPANEFAREHGGRIDPNRELIAIGASNTGAGLFTGFPIGSSLSKSAANDRAGAKTPMSLVTAAGATALVALFLTPLFEPLPEATLGAIVIVAVLGMMKVGKMQRLWQLRRADFWLAMIALVGVLVMPTLEALAIAVIVSLGMMVWRASEARLTFLGRPGGDLEPVDLRTEPMAAIPGLIIVRPDEMLFFANAVSVRDGILHAALETASAAVRGAARPGAHAGGRRPRAGSARGAAGTAGRRGDRAVADATSDRMRRNSWSGRESSTGSGSHRIYPRVLGAVLAFALRMPEAHQRLAVLQDLIAFIRLRVAQPGTSPEGIEFLSSLERRLTLELEGSVECGGERGLRPPGDPHGVMTRARQSASMRGPPRHPSHVGAASGRQRPDPAGGDR